MKKKNLWNVICALLFFYVFFFAGNGIVGLTHPDEVFYVQTAQEMLQHKTWVVPYLFDGPNFEKPIFSYWLFLAGFKVFGITPFSARFFPAVFAALGVLGVYFFGKIAFRDEKKGIYGALILMSSALYLGLARTVFTDMFFTVFIELSLVFFYWGYTAPDKKNWGNILFWAFAGFAVLTKGLLGFGIPVAVIVLFLAFRKELKFIANLPFSLGFVLFLIIALPWYLYMIKNFGQSFISEFFYNDHVRRILEAEHASNDKWFFYPLSMIFLMAPWSLFVLWALIGLFKKIGSKGEPVYLFLLCWLGVVFIVFQAAHSKLVSYILPLFPAMAVIAGDLVARIIEDPKHRKLFVISALFFPVVMFIGTFVALKFFVKYLSPLDFSLKLLGCYFLVIVCSALFIGEKDNRFIRMGMVMVQLPLLLAVAFFSHALYENYATSKNPSEYLLQKYEGDAPLLSSRMYIRAVRFFTQKKVVLVNFGDKKFFSPHPVEELKDERGAKDFLGKYPVVYGVLNKRDVLDLQKLTAGSYHVQVLSVFGDESVVKINPAALKIL